MTAPDVVRLAQDGRRGPFAVMSFESGTWVRTPGECRSLRDATQMARRWSECLESVDLNERGVIVVDGQAVYCGEIGRPARLVVVHAADVDPARVARLWIGRPRPLRRVELNTNVYDAAVERVAWLFDHCPQVCVSFSGGKDSSIVLHLACAEARRRGRRLGCLLIDLEAQYDLTITHALEMFEMYADVIDPHWVCLPMVLRNSVSQYQPRWMCWDPDAESAWVRQPPDLAITDEEHYPFFRRGMEFEEFVEEFGRWYARGADCSAALIGIRTQESLNRWRTIASGLKVNLRGKRWTTRKSHGVYNAYPIYDWRTEDIWRANGKQSWAYNAVYDRMHTAGLTIHQARLCQPYGDDQRKGLWLFRVIEPETWAKVVARVLGANTGALYAHKSGGLFGRIKVNLPPGHTWQTFSEMLLESMPPTSREHFEAKIAVFLRWYAVRGVHEIPDEPDPDLAKFGNGGPSWKRIASTLVKNDWWCKNLSFSQTKSDAYEGYLKTIKKRRKQWESEN